MRLIPSDINHQLVADLLIAQRRTGVLYLNRNLLRF